MAKLYLGSQAITPAVFKNGGSKYGCTVDNFLGDLDANGKLLDITNPTEDIVFTGIKDIGDYALECGFYYKTVMTCGVIFPDLEMISGICACQSAFEGCTLTSASFPRLRIISGNTACKGMFTYCSLTSISFPNLTTISGMYGCQGMFTYCAELTTASFQSLATVNSANGCYDMFRGCENIEHIYFPALTTSSFGSNTSQFGNMMRETGSSKIHTIHFPSNLQSKISTLSGYPNFSGTSGYVTLSFDLPATS